MLSVLAFLHLPTLLQLSIQGYNLNSSSCPILDLLLPHPFTTITYDFDHSTMLSHKMTQMTSLLCGLDFMQRLRRHLIAYLSIYLVFKNCGVSTLSFSINKY